MEKISEIYEQLTPETPEAMERFSSQLFKPEDINLEEYKYDKFFDKYGENLNKALEEILILWDTKEHKEILGHDNIHISYDLLEFLYFIKENPVKKSEKYLTLFGSLLHDLGRYPELLFQERSGAMDLKKGKQIQFHAALSGYLASLFAKKYEINSESESDIIEASKAFNRRIIGAVLFHGGKNEERDIIAHNVQSLDRLAGILGTREFVRNVITDGVQRGAAVYPDERLFYDEKFPFFNNLPVEKFSEANDPSLSWTNIVHYIEMPMRNMFSLSTEAATQRAKNMRRESGIILTYLSGGKNSELYKQIFAPELNSEKDYKFPKNKLSEDIWQAVKKGINEEEKAEMGKYKKFKIKELIDLMLSQQAPNITEKDKFKVYELLNNIPDKHRDDIENTLKYVVSRHGLNKIKEVQFLKENTQSEDLLVKNIADHLLKGDLFRENY